MDQASVSYFKPDYRASFRDGALTLVPYALWLANDFGFAGNVFRETVDVVVADFEIHRGHNGLELIVSTLTGASYETFRAAVIAFAGGLGYRRVWMAGEVIELIQGRQLSAIGVETACQTCGTTFREHNLSFILNCRQQGAWPTGCPLCGSVLPQWSFGHALAEGAT
jgi:hypothetical protein